MGKPQKSNKHKKLKFVDPFYNGERKERMHAGKNLDPTNLEQGISRSTKDLMRRTQLAKELNSKSRRQKKEILKNRMLAQISTDGAKRNMEQLTDLKQKKGEKHNVYMRRLDVAVVNAINESKIEASFKNKPDPVMEELGQNKDTTNAKVKNKERLKTKKQHKKEKEKQKREDRKDDYHEFKDEVKFGEVVHAPPSFSVRPKHAGENKPTVKSLMLYDILNKNKQEAENESTSQTLKSSREVGKGIKRKLLSPAGKLEMDKQRETAIQMYREMKKNRPKIS